MLRRLLVKCRGVVPRFSWIMENWKLVPVLLFSLLIFVLGLIWAAQFALGIHSSEDTTSNLHFDLDLSNLDARLSKEHRRNFHLFSPEDAEVFVWYGWNCGQSASSMPSDIGIKHLIVYADRREVERNFKGWEGHFLLDHSYSSIKTQRNSGRLFRKFELMFELVEESHSDSDAKWESEDDGGAQEIKCKFDVEIVSHRVSFVSSLIGFVPSLTSKLWNLL